MYSVHVKSHNLFNFPNFVSSLIQIFSSLIHKVGYTLHNNKEFKVFVFKYKLK